MTTRARWALGVVVALATVACGEEAAKGGGGSQEDGATLDTDSGGADIVATDGSGLVTDDAGGSQADIQAPTRNPKCDKYDDGVYGKKLPWQGFSAKGKTFTCNACRGGYPNLVGTWRLIEFGKDDPTLPLKDGYKETLTFDGNTFVMHMAGKDLGKDVDATATGWYFCADAAELANKRNIFVFDKVVPEGAFGWPSGHIISAEILTKGNAIAFGFADTWDGKLPGYFEYCKVGTDLNGKPCADPFGG